MDPIWKMAGPTILGKIQNGRHSKTKIIISLQHMTHDVNINFIYLDDEQSIFNGLKVIGMKLHVLV